SVADPAPDQESSQGDNPNIALTRPHMIGSRTLCGRPNGGAPEGAPDPSMPRGRDFAKSDFRGTKSGVMGRKSAVFGRPRSKTGYKHLGCGSRRGPRSALRPPPVAALQRRAQRAAAAIPRRRQPPVLAAVLARELLERGG